MVVHKDISETTWHWGSVCLNQKSNHPWEKSYFTRHHAWITLNMGSLIM